MWLFCTYTHWPDERDLCIFIEPCVFSVQNFKQQNLMLLTLKWKTVKSDNFHTHFAQK